MPPSEKKICILNVTVSAENKQSGCAVGQRSQFCNYINVILIVTRLAQYRAKDQNEFKIIYCSILLHSSLNYDQFTVLCANTVN
jgi:hypothetical protein